jgi:hypothetical protein
MISFTKPPLKISTSSARASSPPTTRHTRPLAILPQPRRLRGCRSLFPTRPILLSAFARAVVGAPTHEVVADINMPKARLLRKREKQVLVLSKLARPLFFSLVQKAFSKARCSKAIRESLRTGEYLKATASSIEHQRYPDQKLEVKRAKSIVGSSIIKALTSLGGVEAAQE